jgi:hypothetical protein
MSTEDVVKIKGAYEKMLEDGTAFKKIDMPIVMEPSLSEAEHGLGDRMDSQPVVENNQSQEREDDWSAVDAAMERRMNSLRAKANGQNNESTNVGPLVTPARKEIILLKKRIKRLEEALVLIMQTQEQLLE